MFSLIIFLFLYLQLFYMWRYSFLSKTPCCDKFKSNKALMLICSHNPNTFWQFCALMHFVKTKLMIWFNHHSPFLIFLKSDLTLCNYNINQCSLCFVVMNNHYPHKTNVPYLKSLIWHYVTIKATLNYPTVCML